MQCLQSLHYEVGLFFFQVFEKQYMFEYYQVYK